MVTVRPSLGLKIRANLFFIPQSSSVECISHRLCLSAKWLPAKGQVMGYAHSVPPEAGRIWIGTGKGTRAIHLTNHPLSSLGAGDLPQIGDPAVSIWVLRSAPATQMMGASPSRTESSQSPTADPQSNGSECQPGPDLLAPGPICGHRKDASIED